MVKFEQNPLEFELSNWQMVLFLFICCLVHPLYCWDVADLRPFGSSPDLSGSVDFLSRQSVSPFELFHLQYANQIDGLKLRVTLCCASKPCSFGNLLKISILESSALCCEPTFPHTTRDIACLRLPT